MISILDIIEKLKDVLSQDGSSNSKIFDKDVAEILKIPQANFATMKTRNKIPFSNILDFCALKKISINWLLYDQDPNSLVDSTDKYWIRYYPDISLSAGGGSIVNDENYEKLDLPEYFIKTLGGVQNLKKIEAINITGESMEPTLGDKDIIFIDTSVKTVLKNGVYAFLFDDVLLVKRLLTKSNDDICMVSDNELFEDIVIKRNQLRVYGKAIGSFGFVF